MFSYETAVAGTDSTDVSLLQSSITEESSPCELELYVLSCQDGYTVHWESGTKSLDSRTLHIFHERFAHMLNQADLARPLAALKHIAPSEELLLRQWNDTDVGLPAISLGHQLFLASLQHWDRVALADRHTSWTYQQLTTYSINVCQQLLGYKRAALIVSRSCLASIALWGCLFAGTAFVPMQWTDSRERLEFMIAEAKCDILLTDGSLDLQTKFDQVPIPVMNILPSQDTAMLSHELAKVWGQGHAFPAMENLAYIMFTSGSTVSSLSFLSPHTTHTHYLCRELPKEF
jgi:non-ribosomal peptide synthetase component F